jgi:hypothetical protein
VSSSVAVSTNATVSALAIDNTTCRQHEPILPAVPSLCQEDIDSFRHGSGGPVKSISHQPDIRALAKNATHPTAGDHAWDHRSVSAGRSCPSCALFGRPTTRGERSGSSGRAARHDLFVAQPVVWVLLA